jgi:hypothetical protein
MFVSRTRGRDTITKYSLFEIYFDYVVLFNRIYLIHNPKRPKCIDILARHYQYNVILLRRALNEIVGVFVKMVKNYPYYIKKNKIIVMETIVADNMCKYFDKLTINDDTIIDNQQLDKYNYKITNIYDSFLKFNNFIEGSFISGYILYMTNSSLKLLQKKYTICDDVCNCIKSFICIEPG